MDAPEVVDPEVVDAALVEEAHDGAATAGRHDLGRAPRR